jgi:membrane associated rhomboid family serine protease
MFVAVPVHLKTRELPTVPIVNGLLVVINVLVFWLGWSQYWFVAQGSSPLSVITYAFAHAGPWHLILNMWILWLFGNAVNRRLGNGYYLLAYLGMAIVVGLFAWRFSPSALVGSSGAIFGVIAICMMLMPAALIEVFYIALFPVTVLLALIWPPKHPVYWFIRWDTFPVRALWGFLIVALLEAWDLIWTGWNWTNLGHLLGFLCGVGVVLLLPTRISMNRPAPMLARP